MNQYVSADEIRAQFSSAMSAMYQSEVPQYGSLLELVEAVNRETLEENPDLRRQMEAAGEIERLNVERHGAIRVGTPDELAMLRRLFAVMGMYPVGYYDLSEAGVPVHSTAFRPTDEAALRRNPFRVFTSLLRLELIESEALRARASEILEKRDIFTQAARQLVERSEAQGGLTSGQAEQFVQEALETFRWHHDATVDIETYEALCGEHRLIADVVCFRGPHINHLTPRTLNIDEVQRRMPDYGMNPKAVIEGPPHRQCPILLRQTSFKALEEPIRFANSHEGTHTARFGEIEQRGVALTPQGRRLYDQLLGRAREQSQGLEGAAHQEVLARVFADFPDSHEELRSQGLAYFRYEAVNQDNGGSSPDDLEALLDEGRILARPIIYEDFLPVSAAGIFQSNLGESSQEQFAASGNRDAFEQALGSSVTDEFELYEGIQTASKKQALAGFA
ncbi:VOC family protein [Marinobacter sp.]|uniref:2-oxoadipate dioxygenase/decarboxylase HglS n=1 Tax=Marinobacter sp. TaxID=50741 RepID=UPI00384EAA72